MEFLPGSGSSSRRDAARRLEYLVFDLETTGLGDGCRIVEFGAVVLDGALNVRSCYETLINPGQAPGPTWLHGLSKETLDFAPPFASLAGDIERLFRDRVVVAHNLRFDWGVLRRSFCALDVRAPVTLGGVCTAQLARRLLGGASSLGRLCRRLGLDHSAPHRAGADAAATVEVFRVLRSLQASVPTGRPCPVFSGAWRLPRSVPPVRRTDVAAELAAAVLEADYSAR